MLPFLQMLGGQIILNLVEKVYRGKLALRLS